MIFFTSLTSFTSSLVIPQTSTPNLTQRSSTDPLLSRGKNSKALEEDEKELQRIQALIDDQIWDKFSYAHMIHGSGSRATEVLSISTVA